MPDRDCIEVECLNPNCSLFACDIYVPMPVDPDDAGYVCLECGHFLDPIDTKSIDG